MPGLTPKQVYQTLNVPPSTLRRWAVTFSDYLSPQEPGKHRAYTPGDLVTFRKIQYLLDQGLIYEDIKPKLNVVELPLDPSNSALALTEYTQMIESALASVQSLKSRLDRLESWAALPWHKRIFTKPPTD